MQSSALGGLGELQKQRFGVRLSRIQRSAIFAVLMGLVVSLSVFLPATSDDPAIWLGIILVCAITSVPIAFAGITGRLDVLEPIILVNAGYWLYFAYAPVVDLLSGNDTFFDVRVVPALPLGLMCAFLGLLSMTAGYYTSTGRSLARALPAPPVRERSAVPYAIVLLAVTVLLFGAYLRSSPLSWTRLLSLGQISSTDSIWSQTEAVSPLNNYLKSTVECFVPAFMVLLGYSKSRRKLLIPLFVAILLIYTTLGFRYRVLVLVVAPAVYWYLRTQRRPTLSHVAMGVMVGFLIVGGIGGLRGAFRSGQKVEGVDLKQSFVQFNNSLAIYQPFLVTLDAFPSRHDFLWGTSFLYVVYQPIPRALWPSKPPSPQQEIVRTSFGSDDPVKSGVAFPNIAEFYVNFGFVGIVVCMFIFGAFMRVVYEYMRIHNDNTWALIGYAVALPFFVQLISRGYFVQTFTESAFLLGPLAIPFLHRKHRRVAEATQYFIDSSGLTCRE